MFRVQVYGEDRIIRMGRAVASGPDELRLQYARSVTRAGQRTLREVKQAARRIQVVGFRAGKRRYTGPSVPKRLRQRIAAAVQLDLHTGTLSPRAQFVVRTAQVGAGRVPEHIEAGRRWRHPIMGNRKAWASSQGKPWFERTIVQAMPRFERDVEQAVERTARAIDRRA